MLCNLFLLGDKTMYSAFQSHEFLKAHLHRPSYSIPTNTIIRTHKRLSNHQIAIKWLSLSLKAGNNATINEYTNGNLLPNHNAKAARPLMFLGRKKNPKRKNAMKKMLLGSLLLFASSHSLLGGLLINQWPGFERNILGLLDGEKAGSLERCLDLVTSGLQCKTSSRRRRIPVKALLLFVCLGLGIAYYCGYVPHYINMANSLLHNKKLRPKISRVTGSVLVLSLFGGVAGFMKTFVERDFVKLRRKGSKPLVRKGVAMGGIVLSFAGVGLLICCYPHSHSVFRKWVYEGVHAYRNLPKWKRKW